MFDGEIKNYPLTFIRVNGLQVHDMADDVVFISDAVATQHVSCLSGDIQGLPAAIPLKHRDHLWTCSSEGQSAIMNKPFSYITCYIN